VWYNKTLILNSSEIYEVSIGPFDPGTEIRWYLNATDNSANYNVASYPLDKQPLIFIVQDEAVEGFPVEFIVVGGGLVGVIIVIVFYRLRRK
ncbi:hypothetical protein KAI11_00150, partial [Candidatus Bathyarchaeota archaeon]|nr:hypothetical protein [Candidatus Bathyarchaeota archaeon]